MINTFFGANLVDYRTIRIAIFSENQKSEHNPFVLIVDDEKLIVKGIKYSLEQDSMEVDVAYDGNDALERRQPTTMM